MRQPEQPTQFFCDNGGIGLARNDSATDGRTGLSSLQIGFFFVGHVVLTN
jgi:hypothetical protein